MNATSNLRRVGIGLLAFATASLSTGAYFRVDRALQVAAGLSAQTLCSAVFVSVIDPRRVFDETLKPMIGSGLVSNRLHYTVDLERREVKADWAGIFHSRSVYRGPAGCQLVPLDSVPSPPPRLAPMRTASLSDVIVTVPPTPPNRALERALAQAFIEPEGAAPRQLKAVVVVKNGKLVGERYAPGVNAETPLMGYSLTKTVINALIGILVQKGRLRVSAPAPVAAWQAADDRRSRITIDQLLRMSSGLAAEESHSGFDVTSRMLFIENDMADFAERAKLKHEPGTVWEYQSPNTLLLSRIIENAAGGREADALDFARTELFWPLGMRTAVLETDAAGTPVGSQGMLASARDWARLGQLYLNDGIAGGARILPAQWVAYSTSPTLGTTYGSGLWTNRSADPGPQARITRAGMPANAFYASGNLGQRIYILPSQQLVVVRLGVTHGKGNDLVRDMKLLREVMRATVT